MDLESRIKGRRDKVMRSKIWVLNSLGERSEKEMQLIEMVGNQNPSLKALPMVKRGGEKVGSKQDVGRGAIASRAMEKSRYVKVIEWKEVRGDDPIQYFLLTGSEKYTF